MQRLTQTIRYLLLVAVLLASSFSFVSAQTETFEGETPDGATNYPCKITSATTDAMISGRIPLTIKTTNCTDWGVKIVAKEISSTTNNVAGWMDLVDHSVIPVDPTGTTSVLLNPGDDRCDSAHDPDCKIQLTLTPIKFGSTNPQLGTPLVFSTPLKYSCKVSSHCDPTHKWSWVSPETFATLCQVVSAGFEHPKDTGYVGDTDGKTLYLGAMNAVVVNTKNCSGKEINVTLLEANRITGTDLDISDGESALTNGRFTVPPSEQLKINLRVGDALCNDTKTPDCVYYVVAGPVIFQSISKLGDLYYSLGKPGGRLAYNACPEAMCDTPWEYVNDNSVKTVDPNAVPVTDGGVAVDPNSACLDKTTGKPIEGCYELYGGLAEVLKGKLDLVDNKFDTLKGNSLGGLLNGFIAIIIGIGGVLAVGMIMYEGFLYMKSDNPNTKTETKSRILKTTLGFLLLLMIFVILRTINPDLLNLNPSLAAITLQIGDGQDPNEVLDAGIKDNPNLAKIYGASKGHWRDGGSVNPNDEASRKAMTDAVPQGDLIDISSAGLTIKAGAGKYVHKSIAPKLINFNGALKTKGIAMTVTEAFKPTTYRHYASCQYKATCIDADIPFNATNVATFIATAQSNGLVAVWETANKGNYNDLIKAGVPQSNVLLFGGAGASHITGDHASVYDYQ